MSTSAAFWAKVDRSGGHDVCWPWLGAPDAYGYGRTATGKAHRVAYELVVGPIPAGLQIDHLCRNRICVNPAHLEPVTNRENTLRGDTITGREARQTLRLAVCKRGHPFTVDGRGQRYCLACQSIRNQILVVCPKCGQGMKRMSLPAHRRRPHPLAFPAKSHPGTRAALRKYADSI